MSSQPPTRYENYPPDQVVPAGGPEDPAPHSGPVVRPSAPPVNAAPGGATVGRRGVVGLVLAVPMVAIGVSWMIGDEGGFSPADQPGPWVPGGPSTGEPTGSTRGKVMVGGRHAVTVADGWDYTPDGGGGLEFSRGSNTLSASAIDVPPSTVAIDDIAALAKSHHKGFSGKIERPVDRSTGALQRARMAGSGTFRGEPARLLAELWIDDTGSGLLVTRILTAKPASLIAGQAQAMTDELSANF